LKKVLPILTAAIVTILLLAGCSPTSGKVEASSIYPLQPVGLVQFSDGITANCAAFEEMKCSWRQLNNFNYDAALKLVNVKPAEFESEEDEKTWKSYSEDTILKVKVTATDKADYFLPSKVVHPDGSLTYCVHYSDSYKSSCTHIFPTGSGTNLKSDSDEEYVW
jgi:hypothetical protein